MGTVTALYDGLKNLVSRLGTDMDKSAGTRYTFFPLNDQELEDAYRGAWLPRKIIEIPAFDAVRRWRDWQAEADEVNAIEAEEKRLNVKRKVLEAKVMARLYGGSAIYIGTRDQDPSLPLQVNRMPKGGLLFLTVIPKNEITPGQLETNPMAEGYGKPEFYNMGPGIPVHPSRLVIFTGNDLPHQNTLNAQSNVWGDSVLQAVYDQVRQSDSTSANIASLVFEAKVDVFKIPGFMRNLGSQEYQEKIQERVRLASLAKGNLASLLMDSEEEYEQKQLNFAGLTDVLMSFVQLCSGAADIPVTRLLGQSPTGMNSTGESDLKNYYDRVSSIQELELQPNMEVMDAAIIRSALGATRQDIHYLWSSLWQTTETERSENAKRAAETIKLIAETGLIPDEPLSETAVTFLSNSGSLTGLEAAVNAWRESSAALEEQEGESMAEALNRGDDDERFAADAAPRTLYVSRKVENAEDIIAWARDQGIENLMPADELHVTIAYSRTPVDWMKVGNEFMGEDDGGMSVRPGGPRVVERLGKNGEVVALLFGSDWLSWRHREIIEAGASWDWPDYNPHITLSKDHQGSVDGIEPYTGEIKLGPEIFEEVTE